MNNRVPKDSICKNFCVGCPLRIEKSCQKYQLSQGKRLGKKVIRAYLYSDGQINSGIFNQPDIIHKKKNSILIGSSLITIIN